MKPSLFLLCLAFLSMIGTLPVTGQSVIHENAPLAPEKSTCIFRVDMSQWAGLGKFNAASDSLFVIGTFNNWAGSDKLTMDSLSGMTYKITLQLDSLATEQFKFTINHDPARTETLNGGNRFFRVPTHPMTMNYHFNNYDTATVPVTFKCHMAYQLKKERFNKNTDYLDIAGNMNNGGAYDLLYPLTNDSNYSITMNISRAAFTASVLTDFKFRINGSWNTAEFPNGGPNRTFQVADTVSGHVNLVDVWYNNQDPSVPVPPIAYDVIIQGPMINDTAVSGAYSYEDVNGDKEGNTRYKWYYADDNIGTNLTLLAADTTISMVLKDTVVGKFLVFEVTPYAVTGSFLIGQPVRAFSVDKVGGVGIRELSGLNVPIYPNPVREILNFDLRKRIDRIEVYNILGQNISRIDVVSLDKATMNTSGLLPGIYLVKFTKGEKYSFSKFIKQ